MSMKAPWHFRWEEVGAAVRVKGSRICDPKYVFFGVLIILGWFFLRNSRHRENSDN